VSRHLSSRWRPAGLADFEPKCDVSRKFGVYRNGDGFSERALFVLDADGVAPLARARRSGGESGPGRHLVCA
jgi:hypothetical protein